MADVKLLHSADTGYLPAPKAVSGLLPPAHGLTAHEAFLEWLQMRAVAHVFGNPGSTEMGMLVGLEQATTYVLGLQESIVVGMADGYAQAAGKPAVVSLHTGPGLGHAMGALFTAYHNRSPLVVTAGQQDSRHLAREPFLSGNLVEMAAPVVKWAAEVRRSEDLVPTLERAYQAAAAAPAGPVFVSIPSDLWTGASPVPAIRPQVPPAAPGELGSLAAALRAARSPAIVFGAAVDRANAWEAAVAVADAYEAAAYGAPLGSRLGFPTDHPRYRGMLPPAAPRLWQALAGHDVVVLIGGPAFLVYPYLPGPVRPDGSHVYLITDDPAEASRADVTAACVGDAGETLEMLLAACRTEGGPPTPEGASARPYVPAQRSERRAQAARSRARLGPSFVIGTLARLLPPDAIIVDEAISSSLLVRDAIPYRRSGGYFMAASGGLGFGIAAAIGIQLAWPERPVVAVLGDGASMYGIQALWTAASRHIPAKYLVLENGQYVILKAYAQAFHPGTVGEVPGLDLPGLDIVAIAKGMGMTAERVTAPDQVEAALARALAAEGPYLVAVTVDRAVPALF
jgi:benzoylformate decarboxylase